MPTIQETDVYVKCKPEHRNAYSQLNPSEKLRRSKGKVLAYLGLLTQGFTPHEAKSQLKMRTFEHNNALNRVGQLVKKFQARKIEELTFIAEVRSSYVYKCALEEFEKSKKDKDGKSRPGNPVYLTVANECLRDLTKLLGLGRSDGITNNGNMAVFNWDSLHKMATASNALPPSSLPISNDTTVVANIDPVEQRIRELERRALEREQQLSNIVDNELGSSFSGMSEDRRVVCEPVPQTILPQKRKLVIRRKAKTIEQTNDVSLDDMCAV